MESFAEFPQICKRCKELETPNCFMSHIPKPERAHHCSICKKCILKYDHHCPWINNCVGHYNHRYFIMFLTFVTITSVYFFYMGLEPFMYLVEYKDNGNSSYLLPTPLVVLTIVLLGAMGIAVGSFCGWHWYLMLTAQTTLEKYDNSYLKKVCKEKGDKFANMYDFGIIGNLLYFLNIGPRGHYPWYTAFLPIRIPPIGNGKRFEKSAHGYVLDYGDEDDQY
ncbi:hypothetical protein BGZ46_000811 [Entomortierella lignicola]|nr:hypothetical protein BGZ46_000811 [Entomortierella lignicola]